jgi:hypothetical protein
MEMSSLGLNFKIASITFSPSPQTQGTPNCRAIIAAWLVFPPLAVNTPFAIFIAAMSSLVVSCRTTNSQICPLAAPATAFTPHANGFAFTENRWLLQEVCNIMKS